MKAMLVCVAVIIVLSVSAGRTPIWQSAADGAPSASMQHPLVGSWSSSRLLFTFSADGTASALDESGLSYHGAWQPVGENGATYDFQTLLPDGGGQGFMGPLVLGDAGDEMVMNDTLFVRIVAPDPADYEFSTPSVS